MSSVARTGGVFVLGFILAAARGGPAYAQDDKPGCIVCTQDGADPLGWIDDHSTYWDGRLKVSGSARMRFESRRDWDFNEGVQTSRLGDDFALARVRVRADLEAHDYVRFVGEIQTAHAIEIDHNNARAVRRGGGALQDRVDLFQGHVEIHDLDNLPQLTIRGGRYTLAYGQQRLIGAFNWSNVARSFQGARVAWAEEDWWIHGFYNHVVDPFDDHANQGDSNNSLAGIYGQYHGFDAGLVELYWLYHDQDDIGAASIDGRQTHSFGTRFEATLPQYEAIQVDGEFVYQDGNFVSGIDHQAFALHLGTKHSWKDVMWTPSLGLQYDFATGDEDPTDRENETFDNLFPTNHLHYGSMDRFSWRNMHHVELDVSAKPCKPLLLKAAYHAFWLDEPTSAAWFNAGGGAVRPATAGADSFVGHEVDLFARWTFYKHFVLEGGYSHFFARDFVDDSGANDDADWFYAQTVLKF